MALTSTPELPSPRSTHHSPLSETPRSTPQPDGAQVGAHWCDQCKRSFERSDHFARHIQSHEDLRLFQCPWCPKGFNRGDLLYRHKQIHTRRKQGAHYSSRASRACRNCVQSKAKCTDKKPCTRCTSKNIPCEPNVKIQKRHQDSTCTDSPGNRGTAVGIPNSDDGPALDPQNEPAGVQEFDPVNFNPSDIPVEFDPNICSNPAFTQSRGGYSLLDAFLLPAEGFEIDPGCFDLDLETLQVLTQPATYEINKDDVNSSPNYPSPASSRFEFFKRSPWLWTPVRIDNAYTTQENLRVNENTLDSSFELQEHLYFQDSLTAAAVDSGCRDRILFMIFNTAKPSLPLQSFPSSSFLERMVQVYFSWNNLQSLSWIHSSSFIPTDCTPELLGLIIAAGSSSISIPTVWKMAYALQERSRLSLSASIENDNSRVRDLQTLQAYLLWVSMGLWSGFKRNMELAESFLVAPITMLRRGGSFARHPYSQDIRPCSDDEGDVLHAKWISWVRQESLKRTAIFSVMTDLRCLMAYLRPPNCSLTEFSCPPPAARDLWLAPDAASWKETFLSKPPPPIDQGGTPSWATIMEDGSLLEQLQPHYDTSLIAHVVVHGFWSQIWAYHESLRFFRHKKDRASQARTMLWLSCQHQDLAQCLTATKRDLIKYALHPAQLGIIAEFSLMALNVSPRELQQFAGRLGEGEAEGTQKTLQQWMTGPESRAAVWHAGQILRLARTLPLTQLREFPAIALYQASLTLWVYGLLSKAHSRPDSRGPVSGRGEEAAGSQVFLDEPESPASIAFVTLGRGVPGISFGINKEFCPLPDGGSVMKVACDIYRDNFGLETASLPPLLESLTSLMTDLGSISAESILVGALG